MDPESAGRRAVWIRHGFPRPLALALLTVTPFAASGPIRAITGWRLGPSLVASLMATLICVAPILRLRRPAGERPRCSLAVGAAMLTLCAIAAASLYSRYFGGMLVLASSGIPDAGNHVLQQHEFVAKAPNAYAGFVSLYAFVEWIKRIGGCDDFIAFFVATYFAMLVYATAGLAAAATTLDRFTERPFAYRVGLACAFCWSIAALRVALPLLHYHHSQGFFPPIFGLLPLIGLWFADALIGPRWLRGLAFAPLVALYRYTYGLNLPDVLLATAAILIFEAYRSRRALVRAAYVACAVALVIAAARSAQLLQPVFHKPGPFDTYDVRSVLVGQWLLAAGLFLGCCLRPSARLLSGSGVGRWMRLPLLLAVINAGFMTVVKQPPRGSDYYYLKTNLHPLLLLLAASVVFTSVLAAGLADGERRRTVQASAFAGLGALMAMSTAALVFIGHGFAPYWPSFRERALGTPPFKLLKPIDDRDASYRIERTLAARHAKFGGYLTSYYPTFNFMNASFDFWNGGISFYWGAPPALRPGYCVFWEGGSAQSRLESTFPQQGLCDRLSRDPRRTCVGYHPSWEPSAIRTLCWLCP
jgi:hypothetical protein